MKKEELSKFFSQSALAMAVILGMLIIAAESPLWIALLSLSLILIKFLLEKRNWRAWSPWFSAFLGALLGLEVYVRLGTLLGQDATVTWVLGLTALKVMDYKNERDKKFLLLLGFVLFSLKPLFTLDIYWLIPTFFGFTLLWYAMLEKPNPHPFQFLARLFLSALPFAALLFFVFPRFATPWIIGNMHSRGGVGFSENFNPGAIGSIQNSDENIFRAKFENQFKPEVRELYWRGIVHTLPNKMNWSPGLLRTKVLNTKDLPELANEQGLLRYEVTLEAQSSPYIFLLEKLLNVRSPTELLQSEKDVFQARVPQRSRWTYTAASDLSAADTTPPTPEEERFPKLTEKTEALVNSIREKAPDSISRRRELEAFFLNGNFTYTLEPGTYGENALDEFLFVRKRGYCEHFAGAYALLVRGLGIPSRVVGGYQGGQWNDFGKFWQVSSKDAHAWVEIFESGRWTRVDPTGMVAPSRIELGGRNFFLSQGARVASRIGVLQIWESLQMFLENLNFQWVRFMLDFGNENDRAWTKNSNSVLLFLLGSGFLWLLLSLWGNHKGEQNRLRPSQRRFLQLEKQLRPLSVLRRADETPLQFLARAEGKLPDQASEIKQLAEVYSLENYQS